LAPGAADSPHANVHDLLDPRHLPGTAHGAREAAPYAAHLVAEVDVRVYLNHGDGAMVLVRPDGERRRRVVTSQDDGHRSAAEDRLHDLRAAHAVARAIAWLRDGVPDVDHPYMPRQHLAAGVEVVM